MTAFIGRWLRRRSFGVVCLRAPGQIRQSISSTQTAMEDKLMYVGWGVALCIVLVFVVSVVRNRKK